LYDLSDRERRVEDGVGIWALTTIE
jgi:hypothetical protein